MKKILCYGLTVIFIIFSIAFMSHPVLADDTCVFSQTADDLPPNIVLLLDSGAEMEHVIWHSDYDNDIDYTPVTVVADQVEVVGAGAVDSGTLLLTNITTAIGTGSSDIDGTGFSVWAAYYVSFTSDCPATPTNCGGLGYGTGILKFDDLSGMPTVGDSVVVKQAGADGNGVVVAVNMDPGPNGFYNANGYAVLSSGEMVEVPANLDPADHVNELTEDSTGSTGAIDWSVITVNGRSIRLTNDFSAAIDSVGIKDNANNARYSANYLNWLFFATGPGSYIDASGVDNGTDLPTVSRFYHAKNAIFEVAKGTQYQAKFGIYYFANITGGSQAQPLAYAVRREINNVDDGGIAGVADDYEEILTSAFFNNINNMGTVNSSQLAEGLSSIGYYYSSPSSGASGGYCQKNFAIVVSSGVSSEDQGTPSSHVPASLADYDGDGSGGIGEGNIQEDAVTYAIPINQNGSTYLDDVAWYLASNDIVGDAPSSGSLCYDALTGAFAVGNTVTGGTSGHTGTIDAVNANAPAPSTSGCLDLSGVTGSFLDNEAIKVTGMSIATSNGALFSGGAGVQNVLTYTVGLMSSYASNLFLINTSNNGNQNKNLYDTTDEDYGKYHFTAESPEALSEQLLAAVNDILSRTTTFTAPVVPVTRTTSGNRIYLAFFKPGDSNFWEGNVTKFGISSDIQLIDANGDAATWPNGAIKDTAVPFWATKDWADPFAANSMDNQTGPANSRKIYTYFGTSYNWYSGVPANTNTDLTLTANAFTESNASLTAAVLGNPTTYTPAQVINYVRGADVLDEDTDGNIIENRDVITGDVLHSEPVVFLYEFPDGSSKTVVFFGANDGMLHAVLDISTDIFGVETVHGTEHWAFIPPNQLHRLKLLLEGAEHPIFIDSTPKIYFNDVDGDGTVDTLDGDYVYLVCGEREGGTGYFALDITAPDTPKYLWRVNQITDNRTLTLALTNITGSWTDPTGGTTIYATWFDNDTPPYPAGDPGDFWDGGHTQGYLYMYDDPPVGATNETLYYTVWSSGLQTGDTIFAYYNDGGDWYWTGGTAEVVSISFGAPYNATPSDTHYWMGETWSEPQFGIVKTQAAPAGTPYVFVGGGYSPDNNKGRYILAINLLTGNIDKNWYTNYAVPSAVTLVDGDGNGFVDKLYVGDLGGQMWRVASFTAPDGIGLAFPSTNEIIDDPTYPWSAQVFYKTDDGNGGYGSRKFFYPPAVTLEIGFDGVFMGTGDRENACCDNNTTACSFTEPNIIAMVKDTHTTTTILGEKNFAGTLLPWDLVDVTDPNDPAPDLSNPTSNVDSNDDGVDPLYDRGWYIRLVDASGNAVGEKILAEGTVFFKVFFVTSFVPNDEPCVPGGFATLYALSYLTGAAAIDFDADTNKDRTLLIGGGIPSKPVTVLTDSGVKMLISVGSTNPDGASEDTGAGILNIEPLAPPVNFFYLWWREFF